MTPTRKDSIKRNKAIFKKLVRRLSFKQRKHAEVRPLSSVRAHFSLTEIRGAKFPGQQTAATSLCALLQATSLCPSNWSSDVMDRLLLQGDKLHSTRLKDLSIKNLNTQPGTLYPEQLPSAFTSKHKKLFLKFTRKDIFRKSTTSSGPYSFRFLLKSELNNIKYGALLTSGSKTVSVMVDSVYSYLFDPCHENSDILSTSLTKSTLIQFRDMDHLISYAEQHLWKMEETVSVTKVDLTTEFDSWANLSQSRSMII